jgi:hypothetical protein
VTDEKDIIWHTRVDKRYQVEVVRTGDQTADLVISEGDKKLLTEQVGLSYDAIFGPDMADVETWRQRVITFIDNELGKEES